jgi:hypothetical protein
MKGREQTKLVMLVMLTLLGLALPAPSLFAQSLNPKIVDTLTQLHGELIDRARTVQEWIDQLDQNQSSVSDLRRRVSADSGIQSPKSEVYLMLALDGLLLGCQSAHADAVLNQSALLILDGVTRGLLTSSGYLALDRQLLLLEQSESQRDETIGKLQPHFDRIDALFLLAEKALDASDNGGVMGAIKAGREALLLLRLTDGKLIADYEQVIKPGTRSLRSIVDVLPKQ